MKHEIDECNSIPYLVNTYPKVVSSINVIDTELQFKMCKKTE